MRFNSKILLFGEYSVLYNAKALSIPYGRFSGELKFGGISEPGVADSNSSLKKFLHYIKTNLSATAFFQVKKMEEEIQAGLYFKSDIPVKYGVGSSGALVAALYDRYNFPANEFNKLDSALLLKLKKDLSQLESFFHGQSSGFDPLVSYLNRPVLSIDSNHLEVVSGLGFHSSVWLVDTKQQGDTEQQIQYFVGQASNPGFAKEFQEHYMAGVDEAIQSFRQKGEGFFPALGKVASFQLKYLPGLFPEKVLQLAKKGLETRDYFVKLCGSGGAGFFLLFAKDGFEIKQIQKGFSLIPLSFVA